MLFQRWQSRFHVCESWPHAVEEGCPNPRDQLTEEADGYPSMWTAIESIAPKIGCVPQTLNEWVKRAEVAR